MTSCLVCGADPVRTVVDFGCQPVSSHFIATPDQQTAECELALAVCQTCGVIQLTKPFPYEMLTPTFDWITYREPESHLDAVVERICDLPNVGPEMIVGSLTYKDKTTLERFRKRGFKQTWMIDPFADLGATNPNANIETVHGMLDSNKACKIATDYEPADILIVRHIAEHAADSARFLAAIEFLLASDGYLVIEVPDCSRNLDYRDYTMMWEEHSLYFTEGTLPSLLSGRGFTVQSVDRYPYPFEDVLMLYARRSDAPADVIVPDSAAVSTSNTLAVEYGNDFSAESAAIRKKIEGLAARGPIALYGAGHLTCTFVNLHDLASYFTFVVDDTPQKQGLFLPGNGLEIVDREVLATSNVTTCLLGLAPEIEDKVISNNEAFVRRGGAFQSIFGASDRSLHRF